MAESETNSSSQEAPTKVNEARVGGARYKVRAKFIKSDKPALKNLTPFTTAALDQFDGHYFDSKLVQPPYPPAALARFLTYCDVMPQVISTMQVNVHGPGWFLKFVAPYGREDSEPNDSRLAQRTALNLRLRFPNSRQTWTQLVMALLMDKMLTGSSYLEIVRNLIGEHAEYHRVPARSMRIGLTEEQAIPHIEWLPNDRGELVKVQRFTYFRKYCQRVGGKEVWFKELGDPRSLNRTNGKFAPEGARWPIEQEATEILHFAYESPNTPYGEPPWITEMMNIVGSRSAQRVNYLFFDNKSIPPMAILVSGGNLTDEAMADIEDLIQNEAKGIENFYKALVLDGIPYESGDPLTDAKLQPMRIEIKPLTQFIQDDAGFLKYIGDVRKSVRESWRIPPVLLGGAEEYSHAAVTAALAMAEDQVFGPERSIFDARVNRALVAGAEITSWEYVSRGLSVVDDASVAAAVSASLLVQPVGILVDWVAGMLGKEPPPLDEDVRNMLVGDYQRSMYSFPDFSADETNTETGKLLITGLKKLQTDLLKIAKSKTG